MFTTRIWILTYFFIFALSIGWVPSIGDAHSCGDKDARKADIVELLSDGQCTTDTSYSYNDYGCHAHWTLKELDPALDPNNEGKLVYSTGEGHGGWDVRFTDSDHPFYSITRGVVKAAGEGPNNVIAVYDEANKMMVLYLHASDVEVEVGEVVDFEDQLGNQGNESHLPITAHVHIEVRKLTSEQEAFPFDEQIEELIKPSRGKGDEDRPTIDPIPYLYEFVLWHKTEIGRQQSILWPDLKKDWE